MVVLIFSPPAMSVSAVSQSVPQRAVGSEGSIRCCPTLETPDELGQGVDILGGHLTLIRRHNWLPALDHFGSWLQDRFLDVGFIGDLGPTTLEVDFASKQPLQNRSLGVLCSGVTTDALELQEKLSPFRSQ